METDSIKNILDNPLMPALPETATSEELADDAERKLRYFTMLATAKRSIPLEELRAASEASIAANVRLRKKIEEEEPGVDHEAVLAKAIEVTDQWEVVHDLEDQGMAGTPEHAAAWKKLGALNKELRDLKEPNHGTR